MFLIRYKHNFYKFIFLGSCYIDGNTTACLCLPQFKDPTCRIDICNCKCDKNDHECHIHCPPNGKYPLCDQSNTTTNLCHPEMCKNGGTCIIVDGLPACR